MKRAFLPPVFGVLGLGLWMTTAPVEGTEARVLSVRRGSGGSPALLLKVRDDAVLSTQDVSALLDAAGNGGSGSRKVKAAVHGRRFGEVAVVAPPEPRVITPVRKRAPTVVAKVEKKPAERPQTQPAKPAPPVKPDVTIFDPNQPKPPEPPQPPATVPPEQPEPKKP